MERVDFKITEEDKKDIVKRTYKFALRTLYIAQKLPNNPVTNRVIGQLVGSGTSIGSNTEGSAPEGRPQQALVRMISLLKCLSHPKKHVKLIIG